MSYEVGIIISILIFSIINTHMLTTAFIFGLFACVFLFQSLIEGLILKQLCL